MFMTHIRHCENKAAHCRPGLASFNAGACEEEHYARGEDGEMDIDAGAWAVRQPNRQLNGLLGRMRAVYQRCCYSTCCHSPLSMVME